MGKLPRREAAAEPDSDHPHTRGEIEIAGGLDVAYNGPSPHAWGNLIEMGGDPDDIRTIPTRVGKFHRHTLPEHIPADHPHTRGEINGLASVGTVCCGPSPHAWGNLEQVTALNFNDRTIPTRVGKF